MWLCLDCGHVFDEPEVENHRAGSYWGDPAWEPWGICPSCGSTEITEAEQCQRCGEWVPETHDVLNMWVCDICRDDLEGV